MLANSYLCCVLSKLLPSRKVIGAKQVQLEISRADKTLPQMHWRGLENRELCLGWVVWGHPGVGRDSRVKGAWRFLFLLNFFFSSFPLMIEAFQPSERGSLVETNKNRSGKLAKSLGSLRSAGGERRWELQGGEASVALCFSWKEKIPSPPPPLCH